MAWIGKSLLGIGALHSAMGFALGGQSLAEIVEVGFFGAVNGQPSREAIFWFLFFGFLLMLVGHLVNSLESRHIVIPKSFGYGLLVMTIFGLMIMPISGWWLALAPAIGLVVKQQSEARQNDRQQAPS